MALSPFWYGALVGLAAWQFMNAGLSVIFYGRKTKVDGVNIAISLIFALILLTTALALNGGVA